jgi:hypothetical protein
VVEFSTILCAFIVLLRLTNRLLYQLRYLGPLKIQDLFPRVQEPCVAFAFFTPGFDDVLLKPLPKRPVGQTKKTLTQ